ncbi:MAG: CHASE2 domain-containing protein [Burkholderiales bacterium]
MRKLLAKYGIRWGVGLFLTVLACAQALDYLPNNIVDRFDIFFYDLRVRAQTPKLDPRIVIVDIDEKSLAEVGRFPWSRDVWADLITKLTDHYRIKAVGLDVQFSEPDTSSGYPTLESLAKTDLKDLPLFQKKLDALKPMLDYDERLATALKDKPVVLGYSFSDKQKKGMLPAPAFQVADLGGRDLRAKASSGYVANIPKLQHAARAGGFFNADMDTDGTLRSSPLIMQLGSNYYESLGLATARVALGATATHPIFVPSTESDYGVLDSLLLNTEPYSKRIPVEDLMKVQIDYRGRGGPDGGGFRYISATDVLHERVPVENLAQRIVLVGTTAEGLNDLRSAPMNPEYPGVEAHANIIASILDGHFKHKPDYSDGFNLLQVLLVGVVLVIALALLRPLASILFTLTATIAGLGFNFWAYREQDLVLPVATALLLILLLFMFNIAWGYLFEFSKGRAMRGLFGEYVAPELVEVMAEDPEKYNMEGEIRELTIMFADVRGFTTISEGLDPNSLREYINLYLTAMSENIRGNRGTLDKYIGDCVMAFWGAPVALPDHAARGVATALMMHQTAGKLNIDFIARGWPPLKIGIGVNTGSVRVGDMGSKIRRAYTVMGDAVNLSSRLEGITKEYGVGVVVGEATMHAAPAFAYRELDRVKVKGKNEPVAIFEPIALESELDETMRHALSRWQTALALFREQNWDGAEPIIRELHLAWPEQRLYELYLDNIAAFRAAPPGPNWDGVTTFKTK